MSEAARGRWPKWVAFFVCLLPWAVAVWAVDPFREVAKDDDWAYALTVQHLLDHHEYRLHDWATANMPAQIVWGAGFAKLFGFSFAALRVSTLVLLALALASLWWHLIHEGLSSFEAGVLLAVIYSSPLVFLLGLSFMTDVPFLSWLTLSVAFYLHACRRGSSRWMLAASFCASAAILTRQFGAALPAAMLALLLADRSRWRWLATGVALPLAAVSWQIWTGFVQPTRFMAVNLARETQYLGGLLVAPEQVLERFAVICQYIGLYALPLSPLLVHVSRGARPPWPWVAFLSLAALGQWALHGRWMPSLAYNLSAAASRVPALGILLTIASTAAAILLGGIVFRRLGQWRAASVPGQVSVLVAGCLVILHLAYVDLIDEYLIPLLPLVVIGLAPDFKVAPRAVKQAVLGLSLVCLVATTVWTFVLLERKTAFWTAAEDLYRSGVPAEQIYAGEWTYFRLPESTDLTRDYSPERIATSSHLVWDPYFAPYQVDEGWIMIAQVPYRWFDLTQRQVSVYRRVDRPNPAASGRGGR